MLIKKISNKNQKCHCMLYRFYENCVMCNFKYKIINSKYIKSLFSFSFSKKEKKKLKK